MCACVGASFAPQAIGGLECDVGAGEAREVSEAEVSTLLEYASR